MNAAATRIERDSMGEMEVPADALYGASTARAIENFPIAHRPLPAALIHAYGHLKAACAKANQELGKLDETRAAAIIAAANEVAEGKHDAHFPVDVYQTGSGTSTNMNVNEVIATLANERLGYGRVVKVESDAGDGGGGGGVHPNDHVNMGQSSNDTFPTAMCIAVNTQINNDLLPQLKTLSVWGLSDYAQAFKNYWKVGRTHLMDATPVTFSQVFSGYAQQIRRNQIRIEASTLALRSHCAIGGTAVGSGINTHYEFGSRVCRELSRSLGNAYKQAENHFESQGAKDAFVDCHADLKTTAVSLSKIANDIRHLGSGPRCGLGELKIPAVQPGSSIMPGKVNPVLCESVIQVCCRVIGNDATITTAAMGGVGSMFELNTAMPVIIDSFLESVTLLTNVCEVFTEKLLNGIAVDEARCRELLERSLMNVTALVPELGYDRCAELAKQALAEDKTIRELVLELGLLKAGRLDELLDYEAMTRPSG